MGTPQIKRDVKIAISLLYFVLNSVVRRGLRMIGRPLSEKRLVILYYHGVPANCRQSFKRQMDALQRHANVVPASYRGQLASSKNHVAITFDDALTSLIENALPELSARSFHATIFVPVGSLGRCPSWETFEDEFDRTDTVMTIEQLKTLDPALVSLGSHTIRHCFMSELSNECLWEEVDGSRRRLAELSGRDVLSLSFPYGDHNSSCVAACTAAGYDAVFSIVPEAIDASSAEILRGRTKVDPSDGPIEFFLKFNGAYAWLGQIAGIMRKLRSVSGRRAAGKLEPSQVR